MTDILNQPPYGPRDDADFLSRMQTLTQHHIQHCEPYGRIWPVAEAETSLENLPFLHVSAFKHILFQTQNGSIKHGRTLQSSATTSGMPSRISLDTTSSERQAASSYAILTDFIGAEKRPLLVLDSAKSLRIRNEVSARIAAALSLRPFSSTLHFALSGQTEDLNVDWTAVEKALEDTDQLLVYGFTWILWLIFSRPNIPQPVLERLKNCTIHFVHSGGWKKLEAQKVNKSEFNSQLLGLTAPNSQVIDFYGLVEQNGIIFPECEAGWRHVPHWADVFVRDIHTMNSLVGEVGQLQILNHLPLGAPYHNVLTEDQAMIESGPCSCGRMGKKFKLMGRLPKAEIRGCANV